MIRNDELLRKIKKNKKREVIQDITKENNKEGLKEFYAIRIQLSILKTCGKAKEQALTFPRRNTIFTVAGRMQFSCAVIRHYALGCCNPWAHLTSRCCASCFSVAVPWLHVRRKPRICEKKSIYTNIRVYICINLKKKINQKCKFISFSLLGL